ncbi:Clan SC, family S28, unassigned serine peptidase [Trichomonas vaginalis G3]|uniref:Clan SC, family S28, unassigned serine peptidase n=1 Tax=Trichomonas vaginalis (strain ATCC PRA-98 / G3) TaxID=412133 RepID=A2FRR3_TRIV3|nr:serine-type peptidase protein [Trichomonas vaginalis G3]EAX92402.1 Clan SC, family S28, unassigned serine peptidase [Trichomonas vaginalis G3]KAI5551084.1 serine-type peptidase protein [Trichomonas vaginalis G3]|eukprot:XP_001305332.1 Clan SC, family S28, unassigned serine peptidase [Trichomonas vaginalis G3]
MTSFLSMASFLFFLRQMNFGEINIGDQMWFDQKLDHFSDLAETFKQRYYINTNYSKKSKNLVVYIGGEAPLLESSLKYDVQHIASVTKSVILALEHRYFGESIPHGNLELENFKYLTVDQAIEDLANFITQMKQNYCQDASKCKALMVGGSYPGALSSRFRQKHPELTLGSWASSAPIHSQNNFSEYDKHEAEDYKDYGCYDNALKAYKTIERITLLKNEKTEEMMEKFGVPKDAQFVNNSVDFLGMFSDVYSYGNQYKAYNKFLLEMCEKFKKIDMSNDDEVINVMADTSNSIVGKDNFFNNNIEFLKNTSIYSDSKSSRSWMYMTCNELGWFSSASGLLRSELLTIETSLDSCKELFGFTQFPDTEKFNEKYGGYNPNVTKVVYTNSHYDPWSELTMKRNDTEKSIISFNIKDGFHCDDLHDPSDGDSEYLKSVREETIKQLLAWMKEDNKTLPLWFWIVVAILTAILLVLIIVIVIICKKDKANDAYQQSLLIMGEKKTYT